MNQNRTFKDVEDLESKLNIKHGDLVMCSYTTGESINRELYNQLRFAIGIYTPREGFGSFPYKTSVDLSANPSDILTNSKSTIYIYSIGISILDTHEPDRQWIDKILSEPKSLTSIFTYQIEDLKIIIPAEEVTQLIIESRKKV